MVGWGGRGERYFWLVRGHDSRAFIVFTVVRYNYARSLVVGSECTSA